MNSNNPSEQPVNTMSAADPFGNRGWREQFISIVLRIACVLGAAIIVIAFPAARPIDRMIYLSVYIILLAITILRISYLIRAFSLLVLLFAVGVNSILTWGPWLDGSIYFIAFILLSSLLFDQRVELFALLVSILGLASMGTLQQLGVYQLRALNAPATTSADWSAYIIGFSVLSAGLIFAIGLFKKAVRQTLQEIQNRFNTLTNERSQIENKARERTEELEAQTTQMRSSTSIARTIAEMQDVSELMEATAKLMTDQFGYYHVGLYLLDERKKTAFLQASSSSAGKQLIGKGVRIEPDRLNIINLVVEQKRPYITLDIDINFIRDANFPLTRSRMMLPLMVRGNVIGVMDIHSDQLQSFSIQDGEILQTLADLVAISIDNIGLINEIKNLAFQLETNTSLETRETWSKFTSRQKPAYQYTPAGIRPLFSHDMVENQDGMYIPLTLHGQKIGSIILKRKGMTASWSERERTLVEKVANQVALALENSRLVDETQKNALRNQIIANISNRVRETLDVESVIRTATTELRRVFDLKEAEVSIGVPQSNNQPIKKLTSSLRLK